MKWMRPVILTFGLLCIAQGLAYGVDFFDWVGNGFSVPFGEATPEEYFTCSSSQMAGSFTAERAKYSISGFCTEIKATPNRTFPWTAQGSYDSRTVNGQFGQVEEKIVVSGPSPFRGEFRLAMVCNSVRGKAMPFDPWLWLGGDKCAQAQIQATGEMADTMTTYNLGTIFVKLILRRAQGRGGPVTASFPYDRQPLLTKRANDLRAEAEALAAEMRRAEQLRQGSTLPSGPSGPYTALIHPSVLEPKANQILPPQRPVSIKLAPPQQWADTFDLNTGTFIKTAQSVTGYTVRLERKNPQGNWVAHVTLPLGAALAESSAGYVDWGTGGSDGRSLAFTALPGRWRLSAQASTPRQSGWSEWVEFSTVESADFTAKKRTSSVFPPTGQSTMQSTLPPTGLPSGVGSPPTVVDSIASADAPIRSNQSQPRVTTGLPSGVGAPPTVLYGIASSGALGWYRHNGAQTGAGLNAPGAWNGPNDVGTGWQNFKGVFGMGDGIIYAIAGDGKLKWYKHTGFQDGTFRWEGPKDVGTGWQNFKGVFGMGDGIIYAIAGDGKLKWYKHTGFQDGTFRWEGPKDVGTGWQNFKGVFGMGNGIIYAIAGDGKLKWYKHTGFQDGTFRWEGPKDVGTGWHNFTQVFGSGNGVIYAIAGDGILKWYKHTGYRDGSFNWEGPKDIGTGWQGFARVVSLLP